MEGSLFVVSLGCAPKMGSERGRRNGRDMIQSPLATDVTKVTRDGIAFAKREGVTSTLALFFGPEQGMNLGAETESRHKIRD